MSLEENVFQILKGLGEDPEREGLLKTPHRVAKALQFLTQGYTKNLDEIVNNAVFNNSYESEMIIVKDIELYSICEHHMLPFFGKCHVGYLPDKKIIGLSKIPRIVDLFSQRLQIQERLTTQIAETIEKILNPLGVAVVIEASHLCARMRGVQKQNSEMVTSCVKGAFRKNASTREEFLKLIGKK
ncbi:MAG TPA: GTP cyclohydrolase I FolE [Spirochaetia bacterium]|nr:MAG: GTP cyclohydrolase I FolE [Spirochaetes bacterium GWB1_36_13]HCL55750.1 GTP cyclohydrolase I FolE [Spirochaetia bacterium]